jgi:hypothetical protein
MCLLPDDLREFTSFDGVARVVRAGDMSVAFGTTHTNYYRDIFNVQTDTMRQMKLVGLAWHILLLGFQAVEEHPILVIANDTERYLAVSRGIGRHMKVDKNVLCDSIFLATTWGSESRMTHVYLHYCNIRIFHADDYGSLYSALLELYVGHVR